eukprot:gene8830-9565_t
MNLLWLTCLFFNLFHFVSVSEADKDPELIHVDKDPLKYLSPKIFGGFFSHNLGVLRDKVKQYDFVGALRMSSQMAETMWELPALFYPYVCRKPTVFSEYINYPAYSNWIDETNFTHYQGVSWSYRLGLYQVQLNLVRAIQDTKKQMDLMGTQEQANPKCYNPIVFDEKKLEEITNEIFKEAFPPELSPNSTDFDENLKMVAQDKFICFLDTHIEGITVNKAAMRK